MLPITMKCLSLDPTESLLGAFFGTQSMRQATQDAGEATALSHLRRLRHLLLCLSPFGPGSPPRLIVWRRGANIHGHMPKGLPKRPTCRGTELLLDIDSCWLIEGTCF